MEGVKQYTLPLALNDDLLLTSIITWGAAHLNILMHKPSPTSSSALSSISNKIPDFMFYHARTIAMLSQRMHTSASSLHVTTIFAITRLMLVEVRQYSQYLRIRNGTDHA